MPRKRGIPLPGQRVLALLENARDLAEHQELTVASKVLRSCEIEARVLKDEALQKEILQLSRDVLDQNKIVTAYRFDYVTKLLVDLFV
jgi:hypothetical protein